MGKENLENSINKEAAAVVLELQRSLLRGREILNRRTDRINWFV